MDSDARRARAARVYKRAGALVLLLLMLGFAGRAAYGWVPERELRAAEKSLGESACSQPSSSSPPDDAWRAALAHVEHVDGYRYYADEDFHMAWEIQMCCTRAYLNAEADVQRKASEAMWQQAERAMHETHELSKESDWRPFVSSEDRQTLCDGPWKQCFRDPYLCGQ